MKEICEANELVLVPKEPTPEIMAGAALAALQVVSAEDFELARKAGLIVLARTPRSSGLPLDALASLIATMAPAYRAMIAAGAVPQNEAVSGSDAGDHCA